MMNDPLYFAANTDAIDISLFTKRDVIDKFIMNKGDDPYLFAGIGDGKNDLPFLTNPRLHLVGVPGNAQKAVKAEVKKMPNSFVSRKDYFEGFFDFYRTCKTNNVQYIFSDRDGVILGPDFEENIDNLYGLFMNMGIDGNPVVYIITGSSHEQNVEFIQKYRIDKALQTNDALRDTFYPLYAENGAVLVDCLTHKAVIDSSLYDHNLLDDMKHRFLPLLIKDIERDIFPKFDLGWSNRAADQSQKIYIPPKKCMFTMNMPEKFMDGRYYRNSDEAEALREDIINLCVRIATLLKFTYKIL